MIQWCGLHGGTELTGSETDDASSESITRNTLHSTATTDGACAHDPEDLKIKTVWVENP